VAGERLVPTHCSFCGVQCGMYLRVADGKVIGVEPRNHDINKQRLCPKGVVAYQQIHHPDRLLAPLLRDSRDGPLHPVSWEAALDRTVSEIRRIQQTYGPDAFGVLGGASMTTEKTYLMGKFARVALRTRHIDYNGRLCMVSAAAANKKAFGIDRAGNPWADLLETEVIVVAGTNVAECFPVAMQYFWGARDRGARLVVVDPRETAMARTADEHVRLRPGTDAAFYNGMLHVIVRDRLTDARFIAEHTVGFQAVRDTVAAYTPERVGEICGLDPRQIERVAHLWGRPTGAGWSSTSRASTTCCRASTCRWPPARSAGPGPATAPSPARATARAAASTARSPTCCRACATSRTPSTAPTSPASGGSTRPTCPTRAPPCTRWSSRWRVARSAGCSACATTRSCPCPTSRWCGPATRRWSSTSSPTSSCRRPPPGPTWCCPAPPGRRTRAW
jgi:hypothetical protein